MAISAGVLELEVRLGGMPVDQAIQMLNAINETLDVIAKLESASAIKIKDDGDLQAAKRAALNAVETICTFHCVDKSFTDESEKHDASANV